METAKNLCVVLALILSFSAFTGPAFSQSKEAKELIKKAGGQWKDSPVEKSIRKAIAWLYTRQNNDGSFGKEAPGYLKGHTWEPKENTYKWTAPALRRRLMGTVKMKREPWPGAVGNTSLVIYALLKCGEDIHNEKIQKGLQFITTHDTYGIYTIGLRCNTWVTAEKHAPGKYMKYLRHDALRLIYSIHKQAGGWHYSIWEDAFHNSPSQYGILGVWGHQMLGGEIPSNFWPLAIKYWVKGQLPDGGWGYHPPFSSTNNQGWKQRPLASMTVAGVASMFVCMDAMMQEKYINCKGGDLPPTIVKGLQWLDRHFADTMVGRGNICHHHYFGYYLYGVERVGRACGYKYFGKQDWYKLGTLALLVRQLKDGSWGGFKSVNDIKKAKNPRGNVKETAFSLLFLARGRHPVLFNKLNFGGDWNNRPRDIANLTRWMSRNYEQEFNWANINLQVNTFEWHDAPILYISGCRKPDFSDEHIKKLRTFVYQGGTIFSVTECNGKWFKEGIREIYQKAFPRYEMKKAAPDNPIYSIHADLKGSPALYLLSNGARPLVIHADEDLARQWQINAHITGKNDFLFGVNLSRYIVGSYNDLLPRGRTYWPFSAGKTNKTVKLARIKYAGNYDPEPLALVALQRKLAADEKIKLETEIVPIENLGGAGAKVALLTGTDGLTLSADRKKGLQAFVKNGGWLVVDSAGGGKRFYNAMHKILRDLFGASSIKPLSAGHPIFTRAANPIQDISYRPATRKRIPGRALRLEGITVSGSKGAVILSREDLGTGLLGAPSGVVDGYSPETAYNIIRNIIMNVAG